MSNIEWTGDLDDDCRAEHKGMTAHCEVMSDGYFIWPDDDGRGCEWATVDCWYASVWRGKKCLFHSGDAGGSFTNGGLARAACEAIMRGEAKA